MVQSLAVRLENLVTGRRFYLHGALTESQTNMLLPIFVDAALHVFVKAKYSPFISLYKEALREKDE